MSPKYRHKGYMSDDGERRERTRQRSRGPSDGPRAPRMTGFQTGVVRCKSCGKPLPRSFDEILTTSRCPACQADLHTCTNCAFLDPASRFECSQTILERVSPKDKANECQHFEARSSVEKQTTSNPEHEDPRDAFERLFKS